MSWRVLLAVAGGALALASPLAARETAIPTGNLVQNPGAEDSPGTAVHTVVKPVGWTTTGNLSTYQYAPRDGDFLTQAFAATIGGGKNFFAGGPGDNSGRPTSHTATQSIDVSAARDRDRRRSGRGEAHGPPRRVRRGRGSRDRERKVPGCGRHSSSGASASARSPVTT